MRSDPKPATRYMNCTVYRCSRQDEMYLYLAEGESADELPADLRARLGRLTEVMQLELSLERRLARVPVETVIESLTVRGWFLQLPPDGRVQAHLDDGD